MTRMDMHADPRDLCRQHLLSNHNECHQLAGYARSADADTAALTKLFGHAARGQIDLTRLQEWHDALARELERRGYDHDSPLAFDLELPIGEGAITATSTNQIGQRCAECFA